MNDTGLNKWDWIAAGAAFVATALGVFGTYAGFKAGNQRVELLNSRVDPSLRQPPIQK